MISSLNSGVKTCFFLPSPPQTYCLYFTLSTQVCGLVLGVDSRLNPIFADYCANGKEDEQEPAEEVIELYTKAIGTRKRRTGS
jgi:hypothetical protein